MLAITDPVKIKAAAAYNAAADRFDDEALGLWAKYGARTDYRIIVLGTGYRLAGTPARRTRRHVEQEKT